MSTLLGTLTKNSDFANITEISKLQLSANNFELSCNSFNDRLDDIDDLIGDLPSQIDAL